MSWNTVTVSQLVDEYDGDIQTGPFGTQLKASDYSESGTPVINVRNIGYGGLRPEKIEYVPEAICEKLHRHIIKNRDIVFGRKGAVDRHLLVSNKQDGWMQGSDCIRIRFNCKKIDSEFISYSFLLESHKQWMLTQCSNKATMASLNQDVILRISLNIPELEEQKRVSSVLRTYDDLIENNRRRIQLLEESARLLYKEWFVQLRFPGHEHVKIIDGVPEGWEKTTAYEVMEVLSGGTPKTKVAEYWDGEIPFFTPKDTTDCAFTFSTEKMITEEGLSKCNSRLYPKYTLFITARGTVGKLSFAQRPMAMNQSCYALVGKEGINQQFLYCSLKASIDQFKARAGGAVFDAIVVDTFKLIPYLKPTPFLIEEFTEVVADIFDQIDHLSSMNGKLAQARDILLPRLMSGELAV